MGNKEYLVCLGVGSNIHPETNIPGAIDLLSQHLTIEAVSSAWESPPVGADGPDFINAALTISTQLSPNELKSRVIRPIEAQLGRKRTKDKFAPRPIDIDILVYGPKIVEKELWDCAYLAIPVAELLPDLKSFLTGETLEQASLRLSTITPIHQRLDVLPPTKKE